MTLIEASRRLAREVERLRFGAPVTYVYNPLLYARRCHETYLARYGDGPKRVVFVGMNPGPWGMAQTGVPFGEVAAVRDWLGIEERVKRPAREHPRRPVLGFSCPRSEVSGRRLWGLMRERFGAAAEFFREHFVANYCPLVFMEAGGRNLTPDRLKPSEREALFTLCDAHLRKVLEILRPQWVIGVGRFVEGRLRLFLQDARWPAASPDSCRVAGIPHPSPANPGANRDWALQVTQLLTRWGVWRG